MFPARQGMDVLDVGCGTGLQLAAYQAAGCRCSGIDASPAMLAMARRRLGDLASLYLGDAARMPYPDGAFDLILATTALHEMAPQVRAAVLGEMKRVLRAGGRILLTDYEPGPARPGRGWVTKAVIAISELAADRSHRRNSMTSWLMAACRPCLPRRGCRWISAGSSPGPRSACTWPASKVRRDHAQALTPARTFTGETTRWHSTLSGWGNGGGWLMEIPQVVHDYVDAFARADVDGCARAFAADGTYSDPGTGGLLSGQALKDHFAAFFGGFPDATCETVSLDPVTEHLSAWRLILRGTNTSSYRGPRQPAGH